MPLLSVIIPVYNKEKYINKMFEDLRNQTFSDFECILVDDGSKDNSGSICDSMVQTDDRFKVIHIPNEGVSNARNIGVKMSVGELLTFVDSDDRLSPQFLENLVSCFQKCDVDMVISGVEKHWEDQDRKELIVPPMTGEIEMQKVLPDFTEIQKNTGIFGICVAKIFRKSLAEGIAFDKKIKLAEDFDFYLKLYNRVRRFYFDNQALYYYVQETDFSYTSSSDEKIDYRSQLMIQLRYREFLKKNEAYFGDNKRNIDCFLNSYVYYTMFYCPNNKIRDCVSELNQLCNKKNIRLQGHGHLQKYILSCVSRNNYAGVVLIMNIYRRLRSIKRKLKRKR